MDNAVTVYEQVAKRPTGELSHEGNRVPDVAVLGGGRLVVAWRAGVPDPVDPAPADQGSILVGRSSDDGRTWTVGVLAKASAQHRYHYVILLHDAGVVHAFLGRITVARDRDPAGNVDGFPVELVAKRSTDAGATWTDFPVETDVPPNGRGVVLAARPLRHRGDWLLPYWQQGGAGVLRSADLRTWRRGGLARAPRGMGVEEPQVVVSQDDPGTLLMVARTLDLSGGSTPAEKDAHYRRHACYSLTATSTDGGATWSPMTLDRNLPNFYVKGFFTRDADGRYVAVYNTLGGPFQGERPDRHREVLHVKVKEPGRPWSPGRLFADGPRLTTGAARGWDVYASADEEAPGRFVVVWEHNQTAIKLARLDVTRVFTGLHRPELLPRHFLLTVGAGPVELSTGRHLLAAEGPARFVVRDGVAVQPETGARLRLPANPGPPRCTGPAEAAEVLAAWTEEVRLSGPASVSQPIARCDFGVEFRGEVTRGARLDPATGRGVCLGVKVANGAKRLMLAVQPDGVWAIVKGSSGWTRVLAGPIAGPAVWRVAVDSAGAAVLLRDGRPTGAAWVVGDSGERPHAAHWTSASAACRITWSIVTAPCSPQP
ncbi:sialidase family protein [Nonomuraea sp. NPDC050310]|uniref:sialidase family protein n=1 Tax=Nonomuraea sp. NPDC050310 TaxID=3154935 RepID=UPI0033F31CC7